MNRVKVKHKNTLRLKEESSSLYMMPLSKIVNMSYASDFE